jgi:hypothetical protein
MAKIAAQMVLVDDDGTNRELIFAVCHVSEMLDAFKVKGSSWRPPDSVQTVAFDCRRTVQILSMNHCVRCRWRSCHDVGPLGYLKELPKHSKREAFWRYVLLLRQNDCFMVHCVN